MVLCPELVVHLVSSIAAMFMDMVDFSDVLCRYSLGTNPRGVKEYDSSFRSLYFSYYTNMVGFSYFTI